MSERPTSTCVSNAAGRGLKPLPQLIMAGGSKYRYTAPEFQAIFGHTNE